MKILITGAGGQIGHDLIGALVTVDYGRSSEDAGFYVNFNHIF